MSKNDTILPTKDEVIGLLTIAKDEDIIPWKNVGDLLGMKFIDSLMPKIKNAPEWEYEGLKKFFDEYGIDDSYSLEEALKKLDND